MPAKEFSFTRGRSGITGKLIKIISAFFNLLKAIPEKISPQH